MKIDERVVASVLRLRSAEFEPLMEYLTGLRNEELEMCAKVTDTVAVYRQQGKVHMLDEVLKLVSDAEKLRDKFSR